MLTIKIMILGSIFASMMILTSCDSSQCMKDYYTTNKDSLTQVHTLSESLADDYAFLTITIIKKRGQLELGFTGGSRNNVSMYLNPVDLSLIHEFPVEGCDAAVLQTFRTMYQDNRLREILLLYEEMEPKAITISHGGVFVALGKTLRSPNPNLSGGILMTYEPESNAKRIVEQIDTNVYLYDDLIY